jgi:hypothetical protein
MQEWRDRLCDRLEGKTADDQQAILGKANDSLSDILTFHSKQPYKDFASLITDLRGTQWGWTDIIQEFVDEVEAEVFSFNHNSKPFHFRPPPDVASIKSTYFMINESDSAGVYTEHVLYTVI